MEQKPRNVVGRVAGMLLGVFSVLFLATGAVVLVAVIYHDVYRNLGGVNTGSDFFEAIMVLVIGVVSGVFALRWLR